MDPRSQNFLLLVVLPGLADFWVQQATNSTWWPYLLGCAPLAFRNKQLRRCTHIALSVLAVYWALNHHRL